MENNEINSNVLFSADNGKTWQSIGGPTRFEIDERDTEHYRNISEDMIQSMGPFVFSMRITWLSRHQAHLRERRQARERRIERALLF